jgi:isopentenyldiphosphate isomerase
MKEQLDIYNPNQQWIGTASREDVHRRGLWHRTFHTWLIQQEKNERWILFQLRHDQKDTHPGLLDITAAGHLLAGEQPENGVRELEEELGVAIPFKQLHFIGVIPETLHPHPGMTDREFRHVYIANSPFALEDFHLQTDEVSGLFRVKLSEAIRLIQQEVSHILGTGFRMVSGKRQMETRRIHRSDLVPHSDTYYLCVFKEADQLLDAR